MHVRHWENSGENTLDKYTVKMFPQAYRDIDKIYEQALLVSNYADNAIALAEKLEKAILSLEEQPYRGAERKCQILAAVAAWISDPSRNASTILGSSLRCAMMRSSIWE